MPEPLAEAGARPGRGRTRADGGRLAWFPWQATGTHRERPARWLGGRIAAALLLASAVPFVAVGSGAWFVFRDLAIEQTLANHRTMARAHATAIEFYLAEQLHTLDLIARTNRLQELTEPARLRRIFESLSSVHEGVFVDLGVIGADGRQVAYVGPFDLLGRDYSGAEWFQAVLNRGSTVSDVFTGYRRLPHSVVAVRQSSADGWWIVRATLDNRRLYELVRSLDAGAGADVFIVNRTGVFQTPSRSGEVLTQSSLVDPAVRPGLDERRLRLPGGVVRQVTTSINADRWLLVVQQPEREILAPVNRAVLLGGLIAALALVLVGVVTVLLTSGLVRRVERADRERDLMHGDLLRAAKLASLGELATGLAHEINNPLAIIGAEQTNLADEIAAVELPGETRAELLESVERCRRQVHRCAEITGKMLQFGRNTGTLLRATEVAPALREIGTLLERRARARNVTLRVEVEPGLPPAWLDENELEQVLANLVNNALDALPRGGCITLSARAEDEHVLLEVADNGSGIPAADLERIFQPFFTTKPVGQGTGLGLAVVYGIVLGWGGSVHATSQPGRGTTMSIHIPLARAAAPAAPAAGAPPEPARPARAPRVNAAPAEQEEASHVAR